MTEQPPPPYRAGPYPPGYPYPPAPPGYPYPPAPVMMPTPRSGAVMPVRVEPLEGTDFGLAYLRVPPLASGQAIGSLAAGIVSILVTLVTICFGLAGSQAGWGALVAGAFAVLAVLLGGAAIGIGIAAGAAVRRSTGTVTGRGMARAGVVCGCVGVGLTMIGFAVTLAATYPAG